MSRAATGSLAYFFPSHPSVKREHRKSSRDRQGSGRPSEAPEDESGAASGDADSLAHEGRREGPTAQPKDSDAAMEVDERFSQSGDSGDLLTGVGSAGSVNSTGSSTSRASTMNGAGAVSTEATPLTNHESSPPEPACSPRTGNSSTKTVETAPNNPRPAPALQPNNQPPQTTVAASTSVRVKARPGPGEVKGFRSVFDPEIDMKAPSSDSKKMRIKYKKFGEEEHGPPPPDPRLAIPGYKTGSMNITPSPRSGTWKFRPRPAPYVMPHYPWDPELSVGLGPPTSVVVTGFDPFTSDAQLKALFGSFGDIAEIDNKTDPSTGTFLGVCSIRYRDSRPGRGKPMDATAAARRAEKEGSGQRIGVNTVRVERDQGGKKCKRFVESSIRKKREKERQERPDANSASSALPPPPPPKPSQDTPAPPPNAPTGPSTKVPEGPRFPLPSNNLGAVLEQEPILSKIKRKPYIFIKNKHVPVMVTTIPHLKKRLKLYRWEEIRIDSTGYFIIFEDHKRGEDEAQRCYNDMNDRELFTYNMTMECQKYGNPNYERSPSPERVVAEKRRKEEAERVLKEDEMDIEEEKKQRALDLDPVLAALEQLRVELHDKVMSDVKTRIGAPTLYDFLEPSHHVAKRRRLGVADPPEQRSAPTYLTLGDEGSLRKPGSGEEFVKSAHGHSIKRIQREEHKEPNNAYIDERRQTHARSKRKIEAIPLHRRLQNLYADEDSDDEHPTALARGTEDHDSRPVSRMSSVTPAVDRDRDISQTPRKQPPTDREGTPAEEESGDENIGIAKSVLDPHLLKKEPEDMALRELNLIIQSVPPASKLHKRAKAEIRARQKSRADDQLFRDKIEDLKDGARLLQDLGAAEDVDMQDVIETTESPLDIKSDKKAKAKKKSKKQVFEEREAAKAGSKTFELSIDYGTPEKEPTDEVDYYGGLDEDEEDRAEVEWGVSTAAPRRTVEDDTSIALDIDGWQGLVKDDEDLHFLKEALSDATPANIADANRWAYDQKSIKVLNNGLTYVEGYYVPNMSGSARTEGVKTILQTEKSKYLPHRIKVAKAREKREAETTKAKNNPVAAAEAARLAKMASTATSRSNRASNRTQVKDINTVKQNLAADGQHSDAIRFNQLKKRKKLVKFDRSAIHGWGLYAEENIALGDMIIEYVGEKVRQAVANVRELRYDKQGMGSSYLFRIDEDTVVDATKKGGIARFINHSCSPNCTAKIIRVEDELRIGIYSKLEIKKGDELTYDYKFDRETNEEMRVPCLCGSELCKGFLN